MALKTQSTCFYEKTGKMSTLHPAVAEPTGDSFMFGEMIISKSIYNNPRKEKQFLKDAIYPG